MMIDEMQLSRKNQIEFRINFSKFKDMLSNVNVEAEIKKNTLSKYYEDDFHTKHQDIRKFLIRISLFGERAGLIALFINSERKLIAIEKVLFSSTDTLDSNSRQELLFDILEKKKSYKETDSLVLIHHRTVDEAVLSTADSWLFKYLKMNFWQKTDYFVNAKKNCLCLDLEPLEKS